MKDNGNPTTNETGDSIEQNNIKKHNIFDLIFKSKTLYEIRNELINYIKDIIKIHKSAEEYVIRFIYLPNESIDESTADVLFSSIPNNKEQKILLILNSPGGQIEPAYLISKSCKELSSKFIVSIPRKAKSAATLLSLGANEIHMGHMSELGPIDPQFNGLPALGLSSALERLAHLSTKYPNASDMFANYLAKKLDLSILGYFERVTESAVQYAQRLLDKKIMPAGQTIETVSQSLVYDYKDHSFVIDSDEIRKYLGDHIKVETEEYKIGNDIHNFLETVNRFAKILTKERCSIVGSVDDLRISN